MGNSNPYDVVLLPSQGIADLAIQTSAKLAEPKMFILGATVTLPHVTVYMLQIHNDRMSEVISVLRQLVKDRGPIHAAANRLYIDRTGYVDIEYDKTKEFTDIQQAVIAVLNPLRDGMRRKDEARMAEATGSVRENYEKYGWRSIGELYRPHMTLTKYAEKPDMPPFEVNDFSGAFPALGLVEMGEHGTAARLIERFEFGASDANSGN